jgi:hypothetical protein
MPVDVHGILPKGTELSFFNAVLKTYVDLVYPKCSEISIGEFVVLRDQTGSAVGSGGFGLVVKYTGSDGKAAALKIAPLFDFTTDFESFMEVRIHKLFLDNPITSNLVTAVYDDHLGIVQGMHFEVRFAVMVTELYDGSVAQRLRQYSIPERRDRMRFLHQGVQAFHTIGYCHLDCCWENTLYKGQELKVSPIYVIP